MTDLRLDARELGGLRQRALPAVALVGSGVAAVLMALPFDRPAPVYAGLGVYGIAAALALARLPLSHPHARFGLGNSITLARAGAAAVFVALAAAPELVAGAAWGAVAAAAAFLAFDGIDGWVARRQRLESAFGERFDMEVDALMILALAAIAAGTGKAGPWVLGLGLMRYGFLAAGWAWPAFARPLPPSFRRKAICVAQVSVLALMLAPPVAPPLSQALAALAFAALAWSFAVDVLRLAARAP